MKGFNTSSPKELFAAHYPRLCHFAWQILRDDVLVQDVVQDAFIALWDHPQLVGLGPSSIKNYLYATVKNRCFNLLRHEKVVSKYQAANPFQEAEESSIEQKIVRSEIMAEVFEIMQIMPEACREVFRLGYLEGLSNAEVAKALNLAVSTVKTQKQRAINLIKSKLNPEFFAFLVLFLKNY